MPILLPEDLVNAGKLIEQARFGEALEITEEFEKTELIPEDQVSMFLTKSRIYAYTREYEKNVEVSNRAYEISQELGLVTESIQALIGKAYILFIGGLDKAGAYISDAERMLSSLPDNSSTKRIRRNLLMIKSWFLLFKATYEEGMKSAEECLELSRDQGNKVDIATAFLALGWLTFFNNWNRTKVLDFAMKSLEYYKEINLGVAIADSYNLIARIYWFNGEYDQSLQYCKESLSTKEISARAELEITGLLADIYYAKGEVRRSIKYRQRAIELSKNLNTIDQMVMNLFWMGYTYNSVDENNLAVDYFLQSLNHSEKWGLYFQMAQSLFFLTIMYLYKFEDSREIANRYYTRLSDLFNQTREKGEVDVSTVYLYAKASMMKTSTRMRDRIEAQSLFKELIILPQTGDGRMFSISSLCDLLLEELSLSNEPDVLEEINPLITKMLEMAETSHNYNWLANTKWLQGKLALIQTNFEEAQLFLTQAQRIAEIRGLHYLAGEISGEHDKLITQLSDWENLKRVNAPMAERIKLASANDVLDRLQGRKAVVPTESVSEQSTVLLILAEGGVLVFSYPFSDEWKIDEDIFSSFLSAFTSFSSEVFSKGLDRMKFGDDMMLMESIGSLSFCYLFKGQTYLAKQKLTKFTEKVQNNESLWQNLQYHYESSQILELKANPQLKSLITETFSSKK
ncbi:MAG: hypothetical protein ACXABO_19915 [Promethearchaeota archaeon]|jgi:tetratricopeptide (TPR) repeat protein